MKAYDVQQGSMEWHALRKGRPTASEFHRIITAKTRKLSDGCDRYIEQLIGERLSLYEAERAESFTSRAVEWGHVTEAEARRWYSLERNCDVVQIGFCTTDDGRFGCSPDGLVGDDGGLELKCPQPNTQVRYLRKKEVPPEYLAQVHGALIVTGRQWWDFLSYAPGLPTLLVRATPNDFTEELRVVLELFWMKYSEINKIVEGL